MAILDADKEGFLRSGTSLIQTIGPRRAQRLRPGPHVRRQDHPGDGEGHRRDQPPPREADRYNKANGIDPQPLRKINEIAAQIAREDVDTEQRLGSGYRQP
ncbi:UvrABC system protein B OS=Streptomyces glaucescens OX=1907 GN=uvrB PE=3 SV=1 [Streptomyces glaucescens]